MTEFIINSTTNEAAAGMTATGGAEAGMTAADEAEAATGGTAAEGMKIVNLAMKAMR